MSILKLRLKFNPGRDGMPLDKVGEVAVQAEKFLRAFAGSLGVDAKKGEWLAKKFENASVSYDAEFAHAVDQATTEIGAGVLAALTGPDPIAACSRGDIAYEVLAEFSRIGKSMDPDEVFYIGTYDRDPEQPSWHQVQYRRTEEIRKFLETPYVTYGSVQGVIHAWFRGPTPPFLHLRPLDGGDLVKCVYDPKQYRKIHDASTEEHAVLIVYGDIAWDRGTNAIEHVMVKDIEAASALTPDRFDAIFGSIPNATGSQSTDEYIEALRDEDGYGG